MEFLVNSILKCDEPAVFMGFEESESDLAKNFSSLGFDLEQLRKDGKFAVDFVSVERSGEVGEYNMDGLFIRLETAVDALKAKRVVLDTLEMLFVAVDNHALIRSELRQLFQWMKKKGLTSVGLAHTASTERISSGVADIDLNPPDHPE